MAALVQAYPQQTSTVTMLQTRPSSASGILQNPGQGQSHNYPTNTSQSSRNSFHGINNAMGVSTYRGATAVAPIAPYAFTSTPSLNLPGQRTASVPHIQANHRTSSAPGSVPTLRQTESTNGPRSRYPAPASVSTTSSSGSSELSSLSQRSGAKDDSTVAASTRISSGNPRPNSTFLSGNGVNLAPSPQSSPGKATPDRYRRPNNARSQSSSTSSITNATVHTAQASTLPNVMQFYSGDTQKPVTAASPAFNLQMPQFTSQNLDLNANLKTVDDSQVNRHTSHDQAKRYRRRSIHTIDAGDYSAGAPNPSPAGLLQQGSRQSSSANGRIDHQQQHPLRSSPIVNVRPPSSHGRSGSGDSVKSARDSIHSRPTSVSLIFIFFRLLIVRSNDDRYPTPLPMKQCIMVHLANVCVPSRPTSEKPAPPWHLPTLPQHQVLQHLIWPLSTPRSSTIFRNL